MSIEEFAKIDNTFTEGMFISKVNNIFIKLFTAIMLDELKEIDHFVGDEVYRFAQETVDKHTSAGTKQMYDELNVKSSKIEKIEVQQDVYKIYVYLEARSFSYVIDSKKGKIVSGNDYMRVQDNYRLTLEKKKDAINQGIAKECFNCGASMDVNDSGICDYCGSVYNQELCDWVLTKIEKI